MAQIEFYIAGGDIASAKRASALCVVMTQQAYTNLPSNPVVVSAAKLAKGYDFLVGAYAAGVQKNYPVAKQLAGQAIDKASEAWTANNAIHPIAKHIKDGANNILKEIPVK
jgi:hypothetical protein